MKDFVLYRLSISLLCTLLMLMPLKAEEKDNKILYTNIAASTAILAYGYFQWDYKSGNFDIADEGWFDKDTKHGGVDKLGHFYTNYLLTQGLGALYERWGHDKAYAYRQAAYSSMIINTVMEIGDGFGDFGFSYEDIIFNTLGAYTGYYLALHPEVAKYVDVRWEYSPSRRITDEGSWDVLTDYNGMKFLTALKLDAFEVFEGNFFSYLELHAGYYTRERADEVNRYGYVGIGINLSKLIKPVSKPAATVLRYYQVPGVYLEFK